MLNKSLQQLLEDINNCRMEMNVVLPIDPKIKSVVDIHLVACIDILIKEILNKEDK